MKLTPDEASGLTGPQVLQLVIDTAATEREGCAKLADAMAAKHDKMGKPYTAEVAAAIAAQIRARK